MGFGGIAILSIVVSPQIYVSGRSIHKNGVLDK